MFYILSLVYTLMGSEFMNLFFQRFVGLKRSTEVMKKSIDLNRKKMKIGKNSIGEVDASRLKGPSSTPAFAICQICDEPDSKASSKEKILVHCKGRGCSFEGFLSNFFRRKTAGLP
jgi:hypothetical protein